MVYWDLKMHCALLGHHVQTNHYCFTKRYMEILLEMMGWVPASRVMEGITYSHILGGGFNSFVSSPIP